ncbi:MAG: hypothetical protein LBS50_10670 [Prevotellaceae bacterium]|nr:hypothetical protein [Prevotellaceae bacterium]
MPADKNFDLQMQFEANVSKFAAAKAYHVTQVLRGMETEQEAKAAMKIFNARQQTEYNTAVARARSAKQWEEWNTPKRVKIFPNIIWLPSRSVTRREAHIKFYNRIWAKNDPFWLENMPGNLWNCKCDMQETHRRVTENSDVEPAPKVRGLEGNPAVTGEIFSENASYFTKIKSDTEAKKAVDKIVFQSLLTWAKTELKDKQVINKKFGEPIKFSNGGIENYLNQPHEDYFVKNEMIRRIEAILKNAEYLGQTRQKGKISYIFSVKIKGKENYLIANKRDNGIFFHGISKSSNL